MGTVTVSTAESKKGAEHPGMGHSLECVGRNLGGFRGDFPIPHSSILLLFSLTSFVGESHVITTTKQQEQNSLLASQRLDSSP